jgi:DNA sulfur modification protein DndC
MQFKNPWGYKNKDLLTMYQGASADGECPLVVDTTTPSCGSSRFGCWVCTLVDKDKSMAAMIQNDEEKFWMRPLLDFRDKFAVSDSRSLRDFRRMHGGVQIFNGKPVPGPYKKTIREEWLSELLKAQRWIREDGPAEVREIELITFAELREIRRIWVTEKHEIEDRLPRIYEEATGEAFPDGKMCDSLPFGERELSVLNELCDGDELQFELARNLIAIENDFRVKAKRAGLFSALEKEISRCFYENPEDAANRALAQTQALDAAGKRYPAEEANIRPVSEQAQLELSSSEEQSS